MIKKVIGIFLILFGVSLLLSNFNVLDFSEATSYIIPALLIIVGIVGIIEKKKFDLFYFIIFIVGLSSLFSRLELIDTNLLTSIIFPLLVVLIGVRVLNLKLASKKVSTSKYYTSIFGGIEEKNIDKNFEGCEITSIFGGAELDFSEIKLKNDKAYINIVAIFGGSEIRLPKKHKITVTGLPIFGGAENKCESDEDSKKEIIVNYTVVFGGIDIRN